MGSMRRLTIATLLAGCASAAAGESVSPAGPVTDAETAIKIAKPICVGDGPQVDRSFNWRATLQGNVWKVEGSTKIVPPACGLPADYETDVSAATGATGTCSETFVLPSLPNNVHEHRCN
jgi:hypothetical protein